MEKHYCDRCGKEIKADWWKGLPPNRIIMALTLEFCHKCNEEFDKWLTSTTPKG